MALHDVIRAQRQLKGWSMDELARRVSEIEGLSRPLVWQTVQQWERPGGTAPKMKRLASVAKALEIPVTALVDEGFVLVRPEADSPPTPSREQADAKPIAESVQDVLLQLAVKLRPLDKTDRKQARAILEDLAEAPEDVVVLASKMARLLGES